MVVSRAASFLNLIVGGIFLEFYNLSRSRQYN